MHYKDSAELFEKDRGSPRQSGAACDGPERNPCGGEAATALEGVVSQPAAV